MAEEEHIDIPRRPYFRRGEITLLVSDNEGSGNWTNSLELIKTIGIDLQLVREPKENDYFSSPISTFPRQGDGPLRSLLHTKLVLEGLFEKPEEETNPEDWVAEDSAVVEAVNAINGSLGSLDEGVAVQAAAPNWLMGASTHGLFHPTPGASPKEWPSGTSIIDQYDFNKSSIEGFAEACDGQRQVSVVILDAVPPRTTGGSYHPGEWKSAFESFTANPIYQRLETKLDVKYASDLGIRLPPDRDEAPEAYFSHPDDYDVRDHGTFIAGIINTLAPEAKITIVEIMNHDGAATLETFVEGLRAIAENHANIARDPQIENWSLIVNCSFCVDYPYIPADGSPPFNPAELVLAPIKAAIDDFYKAMEGYDVLIVAAAGNDGVNTSLPPARYPAAFDNVLGVGALEDENTHAKYSNLADTPTSDGVVVLGGKAVRESVVSARTPGAPPVEWNDTDSTGGILGLYIGKFPHRNLSTGALRGSQTFATSQDGWGVWAGTSFAAGVMSGILAYAASQGCKIAWSETDSFSEALRTHLERTNEGEIIVYVPQNWATESKSSQMKK